MENWNLFKGIWLWKACSSITQTKIEVQWYLRLFYQCIFSEDLLFQCKPLLLIRFGFSLKSLFSLIWVKNKRVKKVLVIVHEILAITIRLFGQVCELIVSILFPTNYFSRHLDIGNPQNQGFFYTGAVIDYTKTEPIIYRPPSDDGSVKFLRTPQYDTDWLSGKSNLRSLVCYCMKISLCCFSTGIHRFVWSWFEYLFFLSWKSRRTTRCISEDLLSCWSYLQSECHRYCSNPLSPCNIV